MIFSYVSLFERNYHILTHSISQLKIAERLVVQCTHLNASLRYNISLGSLGCALQGKQLVLFWIFRQLQWLFLFRMTWQSSKFGVNVKSLNIGIEQRPYHTSSQLEMFN